MPIVTIDGFEPRPASGELLSGTITQASAAKPLTLSSDANVENIRAILNDFDLIEIEFRSFADGRGFSLAKRLRNAGYKGHLRAAGHIISDQFRYVLECGFDDVEIDDHLASRQPAEDWIQGSRRTATYRDRLRGRARQPVSPDPDTVTEYRSQDDIFEQRVTQVQHFTDSLFSLRITRPTSFRFRCGEFAMIGLPNAAKPVFRAYSIASPSWGDELEFYSIKVPNGLLTEHLKRIQPGDTVLLRKKVTGTLVIDNLIAGERLFLLSTGTGVAPFASIVRDPQTYEKFDQVVLTQTCRNERELAYARDIVAQTQSDPLVADFTRGGRLRFASTLTREDHPVTGRITDLLESQRLFQALDIREFDPANDRAMICGSKSLLQDARRILEKIGFVEGNNSRPGTFVIERAFVD